MCDLQKITTRAVPESPGLLLLARLHLRSYTYRPIHTADPCPSLYVGVSSSPFKLIIYARTEGRFRMCLRAESIRAEVLYAAITKLLQQCAFIIIA